MLLGQKFLKVNSIVITNLFYLVFLYDVIELSYFKFYQQITSFKKNRGAFRFYKLGFFDRHSSKPANFNFKKRIRKPIQGFVEKKKKGGIFSFFVAAKRKIKGKRHYYSYLSKRLSFYRLTQNYFLYSFYFLPFFKRFRTKFKAALRRLLRKKTKFSKKHRKFIRKFLKSRKKAIMSIVYGLTMLRWRSQYSQWAKKKKKRNYILKVYSRRKLNGKKKLNRELRLGLGKFFKFFS